MAGDAPSPLDALLAALREAGLSVGVAEVLRVRALVASLSATDGGGGARLRDLLACALVRSLDERATYDRVFDAWVDTAKDVALPRGQTLTPVPEDKHLPPVPVQTPPTRWRLGLIAAALGLLLAAVLWLVLHKPATQETTATPAPPPVAKSAEPVASARPTQGPMQRPTQFRAREVVFTVETPPATPWAVSGGLVLVALALFAGVSIVIQRARWFPSVTPRPVREGPAHRPLLPMKKGAGALLSTSARDDLAFAVDRFVRDEPSPELDLPRSIETTIAEGGRPALVFRPSTEHRTVRIWTDTAARSPLVARFSAEAQAALGAAGLPCEGARYHLVPDALESDLTGPLAPYDLDEAAHGSAVLLVTDGLRVAEKLSQQAALEYATPVLRLLARWPRVTFVAVTAQGRKVLAPLGARFGLSVLGPEEVEGFLEGRDRRAEAVAAERPLLAGEVIAWGAACALCERAVEIPVALALRDRLRLRTAPWALEVLLGESTSGDRLTFSNARRVTWLRWLLDQNGSGKKERPIHEGSLLARALDFWRKHYERESTERAAREEHEPWKDTPAARELEKEGALLDLWDLPEQAARKLMALYGEPKEEALSRLLQGYAVRNRHGDEQDPPEEVILLPWAMREIEDTAQVVLQRFGLRLLAMGETRTKLEAPGRVFVAVGLAAGVVLGGAVTGVGRWASRSVEAPTCVAPEGGFCDVVVSERGYRVEAGKEGMFDIREGILGYARQVRVSWGAEQWGPCNKVVGEGVVQKRCGVASKPAPWATRRRLALVVSEQAVWAEALLDSGSADIVWLAKPGAKPAGVDARLGEQDQLIVVAPRDKGAEVEEWLSTWGPKGAIVVVDEGDAAQRAVFGGGSFMAAKDVWPAARMSRGQVMLNDVARVRVEVADAGVTDAPSEPVGLIRDSHECPYLEKKIEEMLLVRVCGGEFRMGDDKEGYESEKPAHQVQVSTFLMGKYEVSNKEYENWKTDHETKENANWPVTSVSWFEAKGFCESLGLRLPTEAEWEYAARGPEGRKYPWGEENPTPKRAVMSTTKPGEVTALSNVGSPFGTVHQCGNALEWTQDCYDADIYKTRSKTVVLDPVIDDLSNPSRSCGRVIRGGSFRVTFSWSLRAAYRVKFPPGDRVGNLGFRCARSMSPQP